MTQIHAPTAEVCSTEVEQLNIEQMPNATKYLRGVPEFGVFHSTDDIASSDIASSAIRPIDNDQLNRAALLLSRSSGTTLREVTSGKSGVISEAIELPQYDFAGRKLTIDGKVYRPKTYGLIALNGTGDGLSLEVASSIVKAFDYDNLQFDFIADQANFSFFPRLPRAASRVALNAKVYPYPSSGVAAIKPGSKTWQRSLARLEALQKAFIYQQLSARKITL